ncbi:MAG: formylmethanofuran dehydrogenase subunit E family protein [Thermoplasmata archaeon]
MDELWYLSDDARNAEFMPEFSVIDTESSHGRYAARAKRITVADLIKFHGHGCDGLFRGAYAMSVGLSDLFPGGITDRTDLRVLSRNSPCLGDVASYLTGGRVRFGTQDVRKVPGVWYIIQRISDGKAVRVVEEDSFFPESISRLEAAMAETVGGRLPAAIDELRNAQDQWIRTVLFKSRPRDHYFSSVMEFRWEDTPYANSGTRTDVLYKSVPANQSHRR